MSWRKYADWAKHKPFALKIADRLGRGRGRFRFLDRLTIAPAAPITPDLTGWKQRELAAVWLGHATVLLRIGGMTLVTDPVFSHRIGIGLGIATYGLRRSVAPALDLRELPPLDGIVLSHAHMDHLDRPTLVRLPKKTPIITAHQTADLVTDLGFRNVTELNWGESTALGSLTLSAHPVQHWGARTFYDQFRGYNSYLVQGGSSRILYGGDSAYQEHFRDIGPVDLAILGIGAYDPYVRSHATPEQAWQMARHARARYILPMHHATFRLSREAADEPIARLLKVAGAEQDRVVIRQVGDSWVPPLDDLRRAPLSEDGSEAIYAPAVV